MQIALMPPMIFNKDPHALKLHEAKLPIVCSSLGAAGNPSDVTALQEITIRMLETHRVRADRSDICAAETTHTESDLDGRTHERISPEAETTLNHQRGMIVGEAKMATEPIPEQPRRRNASGQMIAAIRSRFDRNDRPSHAINPGSALPP